MIIVWELVRELVWEIVLIQSIKIKIKIFQYVCLFIKILRNPNFEYKLKDIFNLFHLDSERFLDFY